MVKSKKWNPLNLRLGSLRIVIRAWTILVFGGGIWYLFTSGEAIKSAKGSVIIHTNPISISSDTSTALKTRVKTKDAPLVFTPQEKFEAQAADSFFNVLASRARFNGSALVAHDGKVLYTHQFGYSDFKTREMLTDTTEFQLGSVSKQFTAVSIMMLKEKGLLNYDDSVAKYFPDFPYKGVTIRMCLAHRSGLPNYMFTCSAECHDQSILIDNMEVMDMLAKYAPPRYFAPDKRFNYCNTNYCVLAAIVEKISGYRFADFARKNIFEPLGMTRTYIYDKYDTVIPNRATGYNAGYRRAKIDFLDGVVGDKGVYSTVNDLLKWDQALYGNKLLSQATLKEAFTPQSRWRYGHSYGFGWRLVQYAGDTLIYHGGWWHGFNADFIRDVKDKTTIIVLSNHINWCINRSYGLLELFRNPSAVPDDAKSEDLGKEEGAGGM
jgi:CubicO group peptidase (beta-lactamase class C family)